jgi:hypothetical protein
VNDTTPAAERGDLVELRGGPQMWIGRQPRRELVAAVIGQGTVPQVLIRVGNAPTTNDAPMTPRRSVDDVLWFRG